MYIFEIIKPGTWLEHDDRESAWDIEGILRSIEGQFYEANLALNLFLNSIQRDSPSHSREQWEADSQRRTEIRKEIEAKYDAHDRSKWDEISLEVEIVFKREQWQSGKIPREFQHNQSFIYARSFLYALDSFDKFMNVLKKQPNVPSSVSDLHSEIGKAFPNLRGVRNTSQHMEDRSRGLGAGRNPQPLDLKPIDNQLVKSEGGALMLNCLNGTKYGNTMSDGHYGEVDVSPASMEALHSIFQQVLDSFNWKGPKSHLPSI
ncbi:hypothetical protein [Vibrio genomosp. F10]|uniref:hypothetical protein n=1 Tax=Vibrio genomosp. F10 TaxID=723171 RepID=UPI0002E91FE0|nr:hypothetical protein [Vibrio genomosp. F10]OEF22336.1 hypothetical protein A1QK_21035 [Vibrio genomosp. F10 str. 9ZD137]